MYYRRINGVNRYFVTLEAANAAQGIVAQAESQTPVSGAENKPKQKRARKTTKKK